MTSHHDTPLPDKVCDIDVDFQSSISHMGIQWSLPANVTTLVTDVKWGIEEHTSRSGHANFNIVSTSYGWIDVIVTVLFCIEDIYVYVTTCGSHLVLEYGVVIYLN